MPSRSAHGQISSRSRPRRSIVGLRDDRPGEELRASARPTPREGGALAGGHPGDLGQAGREGLAVEVALGVHPLAARRGPADPGQRAHRLRGADGAVGVRRLRQRAQRGGDGGAHLAPGLADDLGGGRVAGEEVAGDPAGPERQRQRDVGVLVHAEGQLEGAAADVGDEQRPGRPAEPAPGGEEGQARLLLTAEDVERDAGHLADVGQHGLPVRGLADGAGDEGADVLDALVLGDLRALAARTRARRSRPSSAIRPSSVTCSERRRSILCLLAGSGWAPGWASTTRRWTVFDPTSITPRRMRPTYRLASGAPLGWDACPRRRSTSPATWAEFTDPANTGQRFRVDLTWLTSSWTCIYGNGCKGIYADRPDDGCCTLGAHFTDDEDVERVRAVVAELGEDEWQHHPGRGRHGDKDPSRLSAWTEKEDGARKTKVVDGACIFLNRPGFPAGSGCALHQHAVLAGTPPARGQARRLLAAADPAQLPHRRAARRHDLPRGDDRRVRPPRVGPGRPRPRLVLLEQPRGPRRRRAGLPQQPRRADDPHGRRRRTASSPSGARPTSTRSAGPARPGRAPSCRCSSTPRRSRPTPSEDAAPGCRAVAEPWPRAPPGPTSRRTPSPRRRAPGARRERRARARRDPQPQHLGHPRRVRGREPRVGPGRGHRHDDRGPAPPRRRRPARRRVRLGVPPPAARGPGGAGRRGRAAPPPRRAAPGPVSPDPALVQRFSPGMPSTSPWRTGPSTSSTRGGRTSSGPAASPAWRRRSGSCDRAASRASSTTTPPARPSAPGSAAPTPPTIPLPCSGSGTGRASPPSA